MRRVGHETPQRAGPRLHRDTGFRSGADGQVRAPGGSGGHAWHEKGRCPGGGAQERYRRPRALPDLGTTGGFRVWQMCEAPGRSVLHCNAGVRGRMADRCPARLQGRGPAPAALGPVDGRVLLPPRPPHLPRASTKPDVAADDAVHPGLGSAWLASMVVGSPSMKFESMLLWMPGLPIALAVLAVLGRLLWRRRARMAEWRQRPDALRDAQLLSVEAEYRSKGARPIVARVDRAYRLPSGRVTLMELKTRSTVAVLPSDVIQLSAQRIALEDELGLQVTDEALVLIPARAPAPFAVRAVQLMSRTAIDALVERRWRLMGGVEVPRWPERENVCRRCGQRAACRDAGELLVGAVRRPQNF